jgi:hypothetical protein
MPRIRSVHPDICVSDTMAALPAELERTFVRLWTHCDDEGRCEDRVKIIKAAIYPLHDTLTASVLDQQLDDLQRHGLIRRYSASGTRLLQVVSWNEYQHPQRAKPSKWPPPAETDDSEIHPRLVREESQTHKGLEREYGEGDRSTELGEGEGASARPSPRARRDIENAKWKPTPELIDWVSKEYPSVDIILETEKFIDHFSANGKPMKDWNAAWRNWMRRTSEFQGARR